MSRSFTFVLLLVVLLLVVGPLASQESVVWPAEDWPTSTPEEQGIDSALLLELLENVADWNLHVDSIMVIRNGFVVLDAYFYPNTADMPHQLWSATKSFTSTLAGIAMDQGLIRDLDQPVVELFPDLDTEDLDDDASAITLGNLLTMSAGIPCSAIGFDTQEVLLNSTDPVQTVLELDIRNPGRGFSYCNLDSDLVAAAVASAADQPLLDYANEFLFGPLGITEYSWQTIQDDLPFGSLGLYLTPHDMARLGYLFLHEGRWNGQQVVSSDWIETVTCAGDSECPSRGRGYGYHWWLFPERVFMAIGGAGQYIAVSPDKNMVVVVTSSGDPTLTPSEIGPKVFGAAVSDDPLPANATVLSELEARTQVLASPPPAMDQQPLPAIAEQISGSEFVLENPIKMWFERPGLAERRLGWPMEVGRMQLSFDEADHAVLTLDFTDGYSTTLPIGLDGVPRVTDTRVGPLALTGEWTPSGDTFKVQIQFVGQGSWQSLDFRFGNEVVNISWTDPSWTGRAHSEASFSGDS